MDEPGRPDVTAGRRGRGRRLHRLGAARGPARREPHAADGPVPPPRVRGGERRVAAVLGRHVRVDLPVGAGPAERLRLLAPRGRHPHAALDRDAPADRPDRRTALGSDRRAPADRGRYGDRGREPGLARDDPGHRGRLRRARPALRPGRCGHGAVLRSGRVGGPRFGPGGAGGSRLRHEQRDARARRRPGGRGAGLGLRRERRLREPGGVRGRHPARAVGGGGRPAHRRGSGHAAAVAHEDGSAREDGSIRDACGTRHARGTPGPARGRPAVVRLKRVRVRITDHGDPYPDVVCARLRRIDTRRRDQ
ncbi:conserved hypothetical protein [Frankia sp. Hr75.2]|nr:conserved hypothetical protein [Frankia sp. Hr75.2]